MSGVASTSRHALLSRSTIGAGVFFAASTPYQIDMSKPASASAIGAAPGARSDAVAVDTPTSRTLPALMPALSVPLGDDKYIFTSPSSTAMTAGAEPL